MATLQGYWLLKDLYTRFACWGGVTQSCTGIIPQNVLAFMTGSWVYISQEAQMVGGWKVKDQVEES